MEVSPLFIFHKNQHIFSCLLLLCTSNSNINAAEKFFPMGENGSEENQKTTLSVGTTLQKNIQVNNPLTLQEVEKMALENDSLIKKFNAEHMALKEKKVSASRLPDPKFKIGLINLPTDNLVVDQEAMTQQVIGLQQMFPPYRSLNYKEEKTNFMGISKKHKVTNQKMEVLRNVRRSWLNVYLQYHTEVILIKSGELFTQLIEMTKSQYRSGRGNQQNVIRAQLERSLLKDTEIQVSAMKEKALASLKKWVDTPHLNRPLSLSSFSVPDIYDRDILISSINTHPSLQASVASANAAKSKIDIAKAKYYPGWMMDFSFSKRENTPMGENRANLFSLMFIVDIPLFTSNRQDKQVIASTQEYKAAKYFSEETKKTLQSTLDSEYSTWSRLRERLQNHETVVLPQARQNSKAALKAYRSQETGFDPLMRAKLMEMQIKLQALKIFVDLIQSQINLLYLTKGVRYGSHDPK